MKELKDMNLNLYMRNLQIPRKRNSIIIRSLRVMFIEEKFAT